MKAVKGYLKGAWDLGKAVVSDPKQAWDDLNRGHFETGLQEKILTSHFAMAYGGFGGVIAGLTTTSPIGLAIGAVSAGVMMAGFGRYHALGEEVRIFDEANDVVRQAIDEMLKELEDEFNDPAGNGPVIDGTYRVLDNSPAYMMGNHSIQPTSKVAPPPDIHL
jgi:hypothetical protein